MTLVDPIGDMLTRIRNGQMRSLNKINIPFSNFRLKILEVLKKEGYIIDFNINNDEKKIKFLSVDLKYYEGQPVIKEIKRVSKPGRRVYSRATSIPKVLNGLGLAILSTSKGVMSDTDAIKNNLGGEIICKVF
jgi:small subunit ribosomal protein S8